MSQILVLDDEENYALMLRALLNEYGFAVDVATSANDAYRMIREKQYALIVSDYRMPLMDGAAFLKKVRAIHPRLPVFLVSGVMNTAELVKVANLGATRVYEKPLDTEMFLGQVRCFVEPDSDAPSPEEDPFHQLKNIYSGTARPSYPTPLQFLPDRTPRGLRWIEKLYAAWKRNDVILLLNPKGGEGTLALNECSCWEGQARHVLDPIPLSHFNEQDVRPILDAALKEHDRVTLVVSDFENEAAEDAYDALAFLYESASEVFGAEGVVRFAFLGRRELGDQESMQTVARLFRASVIEVPRLAGRVPDLIFLLSNQSEQWLPQGLWPHNYSPEVSSRLLGYDWPGNVDEVSAWLKFLGDLRPSAIDEDVLKQFFAQQERALPNPFSLNEALITAQQRLLLDAASVTGSQPLSILGSMGFDIDGLPEGTTIEDFELLFPAVLEEG